MQRTLNIKPKRCGPHPEGNRLQNCVTRKVTYLSFVYETTEDSWREEEKLEVCEGNKWR